MIIYGRIPQKNSPSSVTRLMIIYGSPTHSYIRCTRCTKFRFVIVTASSPKLKSFAA
jgi:hypothetical protein